MESNGLRVRYGGQLSRINFEYLRVQTRRQSGVDESVVLGIDINLGG